MVVVKMFKARRGLSVVITMAVLASALAVIPGDVSADAWTDHFSGEAFDSRWTAFGDGTPILDNVSHWYALYHDSANTTTGDWRGPGLRASVEDSYAFDVSSSLKCVADEYPMGRAAVRLLDSDGDAIYSIGWEDPSNTNNEAQFFLTGVGDGPIYSTGLSYSNSIFIDKSIRLVRSSSVVSFYIDGSLKYSGAASNELVASMELLLLKSGDACPLNPENLMFDSVTADFAPAAPPGAPASLTALPADRSATINWTSADPGTGPAVSGYRIYRGLSSGSELFLTTVGPVNGYLDTGLFNGVRYHYKVSAVSPTGEGAPSAEASAVPRTVPGAPQNLQAVSVAGEVSISWLPPASDGGAAVSGYIVYKGGTTGLLVELATLSAVNSILDSVVSDGNTYQYSVSAINEAGEGLACEKVSVTIGTGQSVPSAPRSVIAQAGDSQVVVSWSAPMSNGNSAIAKYSVRRGTSPGGETWLADVATGMSYNDTSVANGVTYYYTATATNSVGEGPESLEVSATPARPGAATVPGVPLNLSAVAGTGHVLVSWYEPASDGGSAVRNYEVWRAIGNGSLTHLATVGLVYAYADTDVKPGTTYYYTVSALNGVGEGPVTGTVNATMAGQNATNNATDGDYNWLKDWTWMHSTAMLVLMAVGCAGIFYYMSHPEKEELQGSTAKAPDDGIDGKTDEDSTDEEAGH